MVHTHTGRLLACSTLLATASLAHDHHQPKKPESSSAAAAGAEVVRPVFEPYKEPLSGFLEQFVGNQWSDRWSPSKAVKGEKVGEETYSYVGKWEVHEPTIFPGIKGDESLVMTNKAAHHAISAPLDRPVDTTEDDVVVQYEAKFQNGLECGGAYLKLLSEDSQGIQAAEFSDKTPYSIMFGPDKCGATNKIHLIFRYKNPKTGEVEEKHLKVTPKPKIEKLSVLYTLVVRQADQSYQISINGEQVKKGKLLEDFEPAFVPPAEIEDPNDSKPADWVDQAKIPDPTATKPEDWDESAPLEIPDEDAEMPAGWLEDESPVIPDPDAEKPEEWDDEEDGDWIPPSIPNPKCAIAPGCGKWVRPTKTNPAYKGKWYAPLIDNPAYKGVWKPRKIPNSDYYEDKTPLKNVGKITGVGFELWSMQNNLAFDNVYVGSSKDEADKIAKATFHVKRAIEELVSKPANQKEKGADVPPFKENPAAFIKGTAIDFMDSFKADPVAAIKDQPQSAALVGGLLAFVVGLVGFVFSLVGSKPEVQAQAKKASQASQTKAAEVKEKVVEKASETEESVRKRTAKGKDKADE